MIATSTKVWRIGRRLVALMIAHAIAFQALASGLVVVTHVAAAASVATICGDHGAVADSAGGVDRRDSACLCGPACIMSSCGAACDGTGILTRSILWRPTVVRPETLTIRMSQPGSRVVERPNKPRAPPRA